MKDKKYTLQEIEDYLTEIFAPKKTISERKVIMFRACDYNGNIEAIKHCGNNDCQTCNHCMKKFNEYVDSNPYYQQLLNRPKDYDFSLLPATKIKLSDNKEIKVVHKPITEEE